MSFTLDRFVDLRTHLYHFTAFENLKAIRLERRLDSAKVLLHQFGIERAEMKRSGPRLLSAANRQVWLQTQSPLSTGNIEWEEGWDFARLIDQLNCLVFFWLGDEHGPIVYGQRHQTGNRWPTTSCATRIETKKLMSLNLNLPRFCKYNSGAPRCSRGKRSPRGQRTFLSADAFEGTPGEVKEVVFDEGVKLPFHTQYYDHKSQNWLSLFT